MTFVDWADLHRWKMINKALDLPFDEPQETYSTSEHLFHDLGIPPGTKGRIVDPAPAPERRAARAHGAPGPQPARSRERTRTRGGRPAGADSGDAASAGTAPRHRCGGGSERSRRSAPQASPSPP